MRRAGNTFIHSIKDQIRGVRYSLRTEAETPGSALPRALREIDFGPLAVIGTAVGTPAVRLADGLVSQVETLATGMLDGADLPFPCPVTDYFVRSADPGAGFSARLYGEVKRTLVRHGVRNMLVSEHALDTAWSRFSARHGDALPAERSADAAALVRVCAGLAVALDEAKPIQRVTYGEPPAARPHFMLAPNLYCGLVVGLATAVVTVHADAREDRDGVLESADSAVDARFGRFKRAVSGKDPIGDLFAEFTAILPFLP